MHPYSMYLAKGGKLTQSEFLLALNLFAKFLHTALQANLHGEPVEVDVLGFKISPLTNRRVRWHSVLSNKQVEDLKAMNYNITVLNRTTEVIASVNGDRFTYPSASMPPLELKYLWWIKQRLQAHLVVGDSAQWLKHLPIVMIDEITMEQEVTTIDAYAQFHMFDVNKCLPTLEHNIKLVYTKAKTFPRSLFTGYPFPVQWKERLGNLIFANKKPDMQYTKVGRFNSPVQFRKWNHLRLT